VAFGLAFALIALLLGGAIGSFVNVVIYRLPAGLSLVRPASRCPACATPIKVWHNIPIVGWLIVRGRCAACGVSISARYPLIELAVALLSVALLHDLAGGLLTAERLAGLDILPDLVGPFLLYLVFVAGLIALTFIDLDHFIIPNEISLPGIGLGIATAWAAGPLIGVTVTDAVIGAVVGGGVLLAVILLYGLLTGREGMGGGDWKLLALIGAYLGWGALPFVLLAASVQGLVFALLFRRSFAVAALPPDPMAAAEAGGEAEAGVEAAASAAVAVTSAAAEPVPFGQLAVPFGPFLSLAALEYLLLRVEIRGLLEAWFGVG
jgi:leader peptidase (prepilin peptidase)/N-methyltransferase